MKRWGKGLLVLALVFGGVIGMFWSSFAGATNVDGHIVFNVRLWLIIPFALICVVGLVLENKWINKHVASGKEETNGN